MGWEGALLLGFLLLFSAWVSFSSDNQYSSIDSNGFKHYILTPKISGYDYAVENWTNVLFTRYDNPWTAYTDTAVLVVAGIFTVLLMQQPVRLYLINRIQTLFNFVKFFHLNYFESGTESVNVESKEKYIQENFLSLNYHSFKKLKFKKSFSNKFFTIFFVILLLNSFYAYPAFAPIHPENNSTSAGVSSNPESNLQVFLNSSTVVSSSNTTSGSYSPEPVLQVLLSSLTAIQSENATYYENDTSTNDYVTVSQADLNQDLNQLAISA